MVYLNEPKIVKSLFKAFSGLAWDLENANGRTRQHYGKKWSTHPHGLSNANGSVTRGYVGGKFLLKNVGSFLFFFREENV